MNEQSRLEEQKEIVVQETPVVAPEVTPEAVSDKPSRPDRDESFKELRERYDYERRLRQEMEQRLEWERQQRESSKPAEENYEINVDDDAVLEGRHIKKQAAAVKLEFDRERKKREEENRVMRELIIQQNLQMAHPDFREVMSDENLRKLGAKKPNLAKSILANGDAFSAQESAYEAIKDYVLKEENNESQLKAQQERINRNLEKAPPSTSGAAAPSSSPLAKAHAFSNGLTREGKKELYEEWKREFGGKYYDYK
jgi:hypothetical protein